MIRVEEAVSRALQILVYGFSLMCSAITGIFVAALISGWHSAEAERLRAALPRDFRVWMYLVCIAMVFGAVAAGVANSLDAMERRRAERLPWR